MGPLQQVPLLAWGLLVSLPFWRIVVRRRRNISGPSRVKAPDLYTSDSSGVKAPVHEVNDSLDRLGKQSDVPRTQILFFHGFPVEDFTNVHLSTWDNGDGFIWPQAWLVDKFPGAQIFFVKYGAALRNSEVFTMNNIAENLISDLLQANIGQVPDCPVVMVGHCVGGLVIKALCWKAHEELHASDSLTNDRAKKLKAFLERVRGIFYYSTPHHGIRDIPEGLRSRDNALFTYFQVLSTDTAELNSNFSKLCKRYRKWKIKGVGESVPAKMGAFQNVLVVPEASARDGVQAFNVLKEEDHFSVCKPKTITSGGFYHLTGLLTEIEEEEIKLRDEARRENIEIELKAALPPENFQIISKAVVGIQIPLQAVMEKLKAVSTLGLTGMGGSGKTTLAKAVFNELGCNFEYTCFVPDVKLINGTVESVKAEVWKHVYCNGSKVGGEMNWSLLRGKQLLLVLDDIADFRDTTVLSEIAVGPSLESCFIATSRNDDLFEFFYKVPRLDETNHDSELFMSYAFTNNETPSPQLRSLTEAIVKKCEGLPLTLEVLGQWLRRTKDAEVWKQTLTALDKAELVTNFNERLWAKLRPSIDGLEENEKQMFLEASTFFYNKSYGERWTLREAKAAWSVVYSGVGDLLWQTLLDRSLVYNVKDDEDIKVHEQLRSLARKIADESKTYIDIRTLEDFELLQSSNEVEKQNIRALRIKLDRPYGEENSPSQSTLDDEGTVKGDMDEEDCDDKEDPDEDAKVYIGSRALQELQELRYLDVYNHGETVGAAEVMSFPRRLVLLSCVGLNTFSLAHQRRLVVLSISGVKSLPHTIGHLSALRIFTIRNSGNLDPLTNSFGELSALERLWVDFCEIGTLPESFGKLSALKYLTFRSCDNLESLPEAFGLLGALVDLKFKYCRRLKSLPSTLGHLSALSRLEFFNCWGLKSLPETFGKLSALKYLFFEYCGDLECLPESFGLLGALVDLKFEDCDSLKSLPSTFGHLSALSRLEFLYCSGLKSLPETFGKLSALKYLCFEHCGDLECLPESFGLLGALVDLKFKDCGRLKSLPSTLGHLSALSRLEFFNCWGLKSLPETFGKLSALKYLCFENCGDLECLPESFGLLGALVDLKFKDCGRLKSLPSTFGHLSALSRLEFFNCWGLKSLPETFGKLSALKYLFFEYCGDLECLPESFGLLGALVDLKFEDCDSLKSLPSTFGHLSALSRLEFLYCSGLKSLPETFGKLSALKYLCFEHCGDLECLPESFGLLGALVDLKFKDCRSLKSLPSTFGDLPALSQLELTRCDSLQNLPESLGNLSCLRHLKLSRCDVLHHLPMSLGRLAKLEYLEIGGFGELKRLPEWVADLGSLRHLAVCELWSLKSIPDYVQNLPSLCTLELSMLPRVKELPPWLGETGVNWSGVSRKVFLIQDRQFSLSHDDFPRQEYMVIRIHYRAREKVGTSDYKGALAELDVSSLGTPKLDGFLLQEKGIIKRMMGDLHGALEDLTAALECFSNVDDGLDYSYDSWRHRGYVKFLMDDMEGADNDGTSALKLQLDFGGSVHFVGYDSLGDELVEYRHFRLEALEAMRQHERLLKSTFYEVLQKVEVADFQGALASFDVINVRYLDEYSCSLFLQERGVLKRLAGDLGGSLEDLTAALEFFGDDYHCLKHRGYVKYLLGDLDGARLDAERCLQGRLPDYYPASRILAGASVAFMEYNLE